MDNQQIQIRIPDLTGPEKEDLEKCLDPGYVKFEEETVESGKHAEMLTTTAIVIITLAVLPGLTAWLLKTRRGRKIKKTVEIIHGDGTVERITIVIEDFGSEAPETAVLKELATIFKIDPKLLSNL